MGAIEWVEIERLCAGLAPDPARAPLFDFSQQTLALIAHDALKDDMVAFADQHFDVLSRFAGRLGTGTTNGSLIELAWSRGGPHDTPWGRPYLSGQIERAW